MRTCACVNSIVSLSKNTAEKYEDERERYKISIRIG